MVTYFEIAIWANFKNRKMNDNIDNYSLHKILQQRILYQKLIKFKENNGDLFSEINN